MVLKTNILYVLCWAMSRAHRLRWSPSSGEPTAGLPTHETEVAGEACIVTDGGVELVGVQPRELFVVGLAVVDEGPARSFAPVRRRVRRGSEMAGVAGRPVLLPAVPAAVRVRNRLPNSPRETGRAGSRGRRLLPVRDRDRPGDRPAAKPRGSSRAGNRGRRLVAGGGMVRCGRGSRRGEFPVAEAPEAGVRLTIAAARSSGRRDRRRGRRDCRRGMRRSRRGGEGSGRVGASRGL